MTALSGPFAGNGAPIYEGVKAGVQEINDNGGILGQKVTLDSGDTLSDPGDAVPALNKELAVGHPNALLGFASSDIHAVEPIYDRAQIVDGWQGGSSAFDNQTDPWLWRCQASDGQLGIAMAVLANQKGYQTADIFISSEATSATLPPVIQKAFEALGGKILNTVLFTPAQTSYRSEVQKVINDHPAVIFTQMDANDGAVAFANFQELNNLAIPFIGTDQTASPLFYKAIGPAVAKAHLTSVQGSNALTASGATLAQYYQEANGHAPLPSSAGAYDCTIIFALAITKAGSADPKVWVKSITSITNNESGTEVGDYKTAVADIKAGTAIDYEGASGPMDFNQYHNVSGAWDVAVANGNAAGDQTIASTITAVAIQAVVAKEG
jgi:branched-chain amino acid transport system substrate-binding protein